MSETHPQDSEPTLPAEEGEGTVAQPAARSRSGVPEQIGQYRVLSRLGVGGMGEVYEAEQQNPRRRVALKLIRSDAALDQRRVRLFEREVELLGRLRHPGIAAIYEAGQTESGQHYFAMELVRGRTLGNYVDARPALESPREVEHRLALFRGIVDAVSYAHQRGVIHRDLKPSNIIVDDEAPSSDSLSGGRFPGIKILDFGLARIIDHDVQATMSADAGMIQGTLAYMSPEQTRGNPAEIDIRSDVYSLGIVLYEMLSRRRPYDVADLSLMEAVRVICEHDPLPLGRALKDLTRLDPDLETIAAKALEKEPDRRYSSAAALSEDVGRFLSGQPILARPPSTIYQLRKLASRNRPLVVGAAATAAALILGLITSTSLFLRAESQARRAKTEAEKADTVATLMTDMLAGVGPSVAQGRDTELLREILERTAERVDEELTAQPEVEATLRHTLGNTYAELGEYDTALTHLRRALELRQWELAPGSEEIAESLHALGMVHFFRDELEQGEALLREAVEGARSLAEENPSDWTAMQVSLANLLVEADRFDEAEALLREALDARRGYEETDANGLAVNLNSLANVLHYRGQFDEAQKLYREALDVHQRELGPLHPFTVTDRHNLAMLARSRGDVRGAERGLLEVLEVQRTLHPGGHPDVAMTLDTLGTTALQAGRIEGAERYFREALEIRRTHFGDHTPELATGLNNMARLYEAKGDPERAVENHRHTLEIRLDTLGGEHLDTLTSKNNLALALLAADEVEEARTLIDQVVEANLRINGRTHLDTLLAQSNLSRILIHQGEYREAATLLRQVASDTRQALGQDHFRVGTVLNYLALALIETGELEEAVASARLARDIYLDAVGPEHSATRTTAYTYALALQSAGLHREARSILEGLLSLPRGNTSQGRTFVLRCQRSLAESLGAVGEYAPASELFANLESSRQELNDRDRALLHSAHGRHLAGTGNPSAARRELDAAVTALTDTYGPDHRHTRRARAALAHLRSESES